MDEKEILTQLWEAYRESPFASFSLQRKLDLRRDDLAAVIRLINDMADSGEVRSGNRIKRVASTMFKLIPQGQRDGDTAKGLPQAQGDSDSLKGKPLIDEKESLTGEPESDCLSTDGGNGENSVSEQTDPFPDAENMNIGCLLLPLRSGSLFFVLLRTKRILTKTSCGVGNISEMPHPRYYPVCRRGEGVCARSVCQVP